MLKRIKREMRILTCNLPLVILAAFLCAFFGTVLWVAGGSSWYYLKMGISSPGSLHVGTLYAVWLLTYGLVGVALSLVWLSCKARLMHVKTCLAAFALLMLSYLLMQTWYAVFFCTRLLVFAGILLLLSTVACGVALVITKRTFFILTFALVIIEAVQIYFLHFSRF